MEFKSYLYCSFVCYFYPSREFITDKKLQRIFIPMFSAHFHGAMRILSHAPSVTRDIRFNVISEDMWNSHLFQSVWQWNRDCMKKNNNLGLSQLGLKHPIFTFTKLRQTLIICATLAVIPLEIFLILNSTYLYTVYLGDIRIKKNPAW